MLFHDAWQLKRGIWVVRRTVRDRNDQNPRVAVMILGRENDGARPIFAAFFPAFSMFPQPKIRIPNDEAWFRPG